MKILELNMEKGWRGGERQTLLSMQEFRKKGHEVTLMARRDCDLAKAAKDDGFNVIEGKSSSSTGLLLLKGAARGFDIVHSQTPSTLTWATLLKSTYKAPLVFTRRTDFPVKRKKTAAVRKKWMMCDQLVAISRSAASEPQRLGIDVVFIPSAIVETPQDPNRFNKLLAERGIAPGTRIIGAVSALKPEKGGEDLIEAAATLKERRQDFAILHFGSGPEQAYFEQKIKDLGLEKYYHLMGFHALPEALYGSFDVFCCASRIEAMGSSLLDAFMQRIPIVAAASEGPKELLEDGRGILCEVQDPQDLADALNKALEGGPAVDECCKKAYNYLMRENIAPVMAQRYLDLFQQLHHRK